jgi:phosphatidylserine/phosphatidylglycerophosphate/cardiolipin synthase-like enzyme
MTADPATWLVPFSTTDPTAPNGDGRPWGDGTAMAARAAHGVPPYDTNCEVTTIIGGYAAMLAMRAALEQAIADGQAAEQAGSHPAGQRGHVYIANWRLNAQRDLSDANPWLTHIWKASDRATTADQTALGLVLRLMQAGVRVRILIWLPTKASVKGAGPAHLEDHYYIARAVAAESDRLNKKWNLQDPIGVVGLDLRTAEGSVAGAHHQKMMVIRGLTQDVAFCGGVDFAFTRRDSPADPSSYDPAKTQFLNGDWQSANGFPPLAKSWPPGATLWPPDATTDYSALAALDIPTDLQESDLPETEDNPPKRDIYGFVAHIWHDQHLKLEGPIVSTLEDQFAERWRDTAQVFGLSDPANRSAGQVIFSSPAAFDAQTGAITPLPLSSQVASPPGASSTVQLLRTIPWRDSRTGPPFQRAEFTVMGGVLAATKAATELVWIFDQYFWSLPLARLLNYRICQPGSGLHIILILPPYADTRPKIIHLARQRALQALADQAPAGRIGVYDLWDPRGAGRGIYCHAKMQTYDGSLMICGSPNMNRRSFACDSEIACAVLDLAVVSQHQQRLWELLFNGVSSQSGTWPGLDLNQQGNGAKFFAAFDAAAQDPAAYVRPDPWQSSAPALPNGVPLPRGQFGSTAFIDRIFDPTSLDRVMEADVSYRDANGNLVTRQARLDDVVKAIENCVRLPSGKVITPWRRQS